MSEIVLDGAQGEGGGQVLRSALSLAMATGRPFRIERIRAKRAKPGLMRQHLAAVRAAAEVCAAQVAGAEIGATSLSFTPGPVRGGAYRFAVGTAGSATLVAQTVLPALMTAPEASVLELEGGTHNPFAPPFDFLADSFLPCLWAMGVGATARLSRAGFYPAGGGHFTLTIEPTDKLTPLEILDRGPRVGVEARALVANLPARIATRELAVVARRFNWPEENLHCQIDTGNPGPGNVLLLKFAFKNVTEIFTGFGELGVAAEEVAEKTVRQAQKYLRTAAAVGPHLADQLLLPMALAGAGAFTTLRPSRHTRTNIAVIQRFLEVPITLVEGDDKLTRITIGAAAAPTA